MTPQLPSFLRRRLLLSDSRKALLAGEPGQALDLLDDTCLQGAVEAEKLRERILDLLCREAAKLESEGHPGEAARLFDRVLKYDAARVQVWRRRLDADAKGSQSASLSGVRREAQEGIIGAMESLLGRMRDERSRAGTKTEAAGSDHDLAPRVLSSTPEPTEQGLSRSSPIQPAFDLEIDGVGEFLVVSGSLVTIGHPGGQVADLRILADIDPSHVRLVCSESFHAGPGWRVEPVGEQVIAVRGQPIDPGGAVMHDDDEVQLAGDLTFVFRRLDAASGSAILELLHGAECAGRKRVLLLAPGPFGRVRLGPLSEGYFRTSRLKEEVTLRIEDSSLVVESPAELQVESAQAHLPGLFEPISGGVRISCPPAARVEILIDREEPEDLSRSISVSPPAAWADIKRPT